jgi:hypothetical protein
MREIMSESDPTVLRFLPDRQRRRWEVGVMKSTNGNADMARPQVGLPKHRRSACRAKMHPDLSSLLPVADIDFGRSIRANMHPLEKGNNAEHRAGPPLTLATMAGAYGIGIGGHFDTQGTTRTMRGSRHSTPPSSTGLRFPIISATRKVAECPEDRHVVPGHPPLCDLSAFDAEHCPEIKLRLPPRRWKWAHWPLLRALVRGPRSDEIPLGDGALFIRFAGGETIALFVRFSTQSTTTNDQGNPS